MFLKCLVLYSAGQSSSAWQHMLARWSASCVFCFASSAIRFFKFFIIITFFTKGWFSYLQPTVPVVDDQGGVCDQTHCHQKLKNCKSHQTVSDHYWSLIIGRCTAYYKWANLWSGISCLVASISLYSSNDGWTFQRHSTQQLISDPIALVRSIPATNNWIRDQF